MAIRPDKDVLNEHAKFTKFDKYKQKPEIMKVADISQKDIDLSDKKGYSKLDLDILGKYAPNQDIDTIRTIEPGLSTGEHGITDQEIKDVLSGKIKEPTGIHKKK